MDYREEIYQIISSRLDRLLLTNPVDEIDIQERIVLNEYCKDCEAYCSEDEVCDHYKRQGDKVEFYITGWSYYDEKHISTKRCLDIIDSQYSKQQLKKYCYKDDFPCRPDQLKINIYRNGQLINWCWEPIGWIGCY